jgi:hypothetical protein
MRKLNTHPGKAARRKPKAPDAPYRELLSGVVGLIEQARLAAVRSVNVVLTYTYWLVGQRIVEHEQTGSERAAYGEELIRRLAEDLTARLGRGFSERNIRQMRLFYLGWQIPQTASAELSPSAIWQTLSAESGFPLPWSAGRCRDTRPSCSSCFARCPDSSLRERRRKCPGRCGCLC